jgi:L-lactate dehydrogenase (cytochrome)
VVKRRVPRPRELAPLLQFKRPQLNSTQRRLAAALTIDDLRRLAKRRTPRAAFDYADGAAEEELSLARARQAFRDIEFHPTVLRDVVKVDASASVLGDGVAMPFGIAPTGFTRLMHTEGEIAGARAAARAGIPFSLSTLGTTSIEAVKVANPYGRNWFQLYMWKDRDRSMALVERAADAGYDTLLVTVDVPVAGARLRDTRNGMSIPPMLTLRTVLDAVPHPRWWFDLLTTEPLSFASLDRWSGTVAEYLDAAFDPSVTFDDLAWIKTQWPNKLVVKGIQTLDDARAVVDSRRRRRRAVQSRRTSTRPRAGAVSPAPPPSPRARWRNRDFAGHRDHVRRRHSRGRCARCAVHLGRARLPVRVDSRRRGRRAPSPRDFV